MKEQLQEWAEKISANKKGLDKEMFNEIIKRTIKMLNEKEYQETYNWLNEQYNKGINNQMKGPHLLATTSKTIKDKLWSINREEGKK